MKTFKEHILNEGISDIVYHYTYMSKLTEILKSNKFKLTTDASGGAETGLGKKGKWYFLSTTRHKLGGYNLRAGDGYVMIKLDGRKLAQKYKGGPVNYWSDVGGNPAEKEAEDRIWHSEQFIDNATQYILEVHSLQETEEKYFNSMDHLFWEKDENGDPIPPEPEYKPERYKTDESVARQLRALWMELIKKKIPHWFYKDRKNFLLQNKSKAVKIDISAIKLAEKPIEYWWRSIRGRRVFIPYQEAYYKKDYKQLSKEGRRFVDALEYAEKGSTRYDELITSLSNDIHNNKSDSSVQKIVDIFKKLEIRTPEEFIIWAKNKWHNK